MHITAHSLHDHPVVLQPAPARRDWPGDAARLLADPTLQAATAQGWDLLSPFTFEAVWNGGPDASDIIIDTPGFVISEAGHGVLTFRTGYQIELDPGHHLWVRGPTNHLKDAIQPLDQIVESDLLPYVLTVNWRFTRPNQTVRFEQGEPFATILPYPANYLEQFEGTIAEDTVPELPGVSCICPTYGRPALLEEAIQSFLRQDYRGPKELIVLNDFDQQVLVYDHPDVQIVNVPYRFRTLGEKLNALVGLATYDLLAVWTDDDLSLPHRLSLSVGKLEERFGFFKASTAFFWNNGTITGPDRNVFHGGSLWTRELFTSVRGYPHATNGVDQAIERDFAAARLDATIPVDLPPEACYYLYRWAGTGSYHLSVIDRDGADPHGAYACAEAYVQDQAAAGAIPVGQIVLTPTWRRDYLADARAYVEQLAAQAPAAGLAAPTLDEPDPAQSLPIVFNVLPRPVPEDEALGLFRGGYARRISVVLPACNEAQLLERTLTQFRATLPPCSEIIVVDNGSTDGTGDFLADRTTLPPATDPTPFEFEDPAEGVAIRLYRYERQLGVAGARNAGLERARGEVVVFSDAHNDAPPGWWPPIIRALNEMGVGLVGPSFGIMGVEGAPRSCGQRIAENNLRVEWLPDGRAEPHPVPTLGGGFMVARRDVLDDAGGFDGGMPQWGSEDLEICLRMWLLGYEVWVVPEVEIAHYFRKKSPYSVQPVHVLHNLLRTALLHLNEDRIAHVLHRQLGQVHFARALALCTSSDVARRRDALRARRKHDDDWYFNHEAFRDIEMELRNVMAPVRV